MSGKISSAVSSSEKLDVSNMSFEERLQYGAENAVRCMGVSPHDRVFVITDYRIGLYGCATVVPAFWSCTSM